MSLLFLFVSVHLYATPIEIKDINDKYEVRIFKSTDLASADSYWEIRNKKDNSIAFDETMLPNYQKGDEFAYQYNLDFDGKTLMISSWSGGVHCCFYSRFFDIQDNGSLEFKKIVYGGHCHVKYDDNLISTCDNAFAYALSSFAGSPLPTIFFENYEFAYDKMKDQKIKPFEDILQDAINDDYYLPSSFVSIDKKIIESFSNQLYLYIVDYIYAGQIDMAVELFNRYNEQIKIKFQNENKPYNLVDNEYIFAKIIKQLKRSSYYENIKKLNEGNKHYYWFNG